MSGHSTNLVSALSKSQSITKCFYRISVFKDLYPFYKSIRPIGFQAIEGEECLQVVRIGQPEKVHREWHHFPGLKNIDSPSSGYFQNS